MASTTYHIRSPQSSQEWIEVIRLLIDYRNEFNNDSCFSSFEAEMANIESLYDQEGLLKLIAISEPEEELVACIAYRTFGPGVAEMKRLYVKPAHRGRHLGRILAETIIAKATEQGFKKIILDTMVEMKAARQLYHQLGFYMIPPYDHQDPERIVCYEKNLKEK
ncbi:MAG: GNAT family N-acetyltransferase [Saprospiraceae bacterium]|nr:GNAT family N-acetyltransferase [Saprospiraceae bacterium]